MTDKKRREQVPKTVRIKDLRRVELVFFTSGILAAALILFLYLFVIKRGVIISQASENYYKGLDDKYGKYYQMEEKIKGEALYKYEDKGVNDVLLALDILSNLDDEYACYYTAEEFAEFEKRYHSYSGIGLVSKERGGKLVVDRLLYDGPADEAGVKAGDEIISVNGKKPSDLEELEDMLKGKNGDIIKLMISRDGEKKTFEIAITDIEVKTVSSKVYDKDKKIGYIEINRFAEDTCDEFKTAVKELKNKGCDKLILDLRNNSGGMQESGIDIADELLPSCRIISEKNNKNKEKIHNSDQSSIEMKYAILVNGKTASSSEIVTAAVKGNKGGAIIGEKTYGKGVVQSMYKLSDGSAFKFTISEYFAPDGSKINGKGIEPDIKASDDEIFEAAVNYLMKSGSKKVD